MAKKIVYPFLPKKPSEISEGDFYFIPLSNGRFACGRILLIERTSSGRKTKSLLVGLHDWSGNEHPTAACIHECKIVEQGVMHINSIDVVGGKVLGNKPLEEDKLKPNLQVEAGYLIDGFESVEQLPPEDYKKYSSRSSYGLDFIRLLAEDHFVSNAES